MLNERDHAWIVACFYRVLEESYGGRGVEIFRKAAQSYGEQRGRRMSLRALRDGNPLTFDAYFAYGEWAGTPGASDVVKTAEPGVVEERVTCCPWADLFREAGSLDCGECYCHEIDRAIVRGFSPDLLLEQDGTIHREGRCRFYFRDPRITAGTLTKPDLPAPVGGDRIQPFDYHVGHVYQAFARTVEDVCGREPLERVRERLRRRFDEGIMELLDAFGGVDFGRLPEGD